MVTVRSITTLAAILPIAASAPLEGRAKSKGFLNQLNETTWVFGNNVWNLTQGRQYANKLYYKNTDLVGDAWGHYVSYSKPKTLSTPSVRYKTDSDRRCGC